MPAGRPRTFTVEEFSQAWDDYFNWVDNNPWYKNEAIKAGENAGMIIKIPTARPYSEIGFCAYNDLGEHYINQLAKSLEGREDEESQQFSYILTRARAKCKSQKFEGAAVGAFNANIIARDLGLADKNQVDHTTNGKDIVAIRVVDIDGSEI
jgi:hypothetical protein